MGRKGVLLADPVSDLFTRIRNGQAAKRMSIRHPYSRFALSIVDALVRHSYVESVKIIPPASPKAPQFDHLEISLKYDNTGNGVIRKIKRISKPSRRIYRAIDELPLASGGLGAWILSTPKGVLHCAEARERRVGGEVLGEVL